MVCKSGLCKHTGAPLEETHVRNGDQARGQIEFVSFFSPLSNFEASRAELGPTQVELCCAVLRAKRTEEEKEKKRPSFVCGDSQLLRLSLVLLVSRPVGSQATMEAVICYGYTNGHPTRVSLSLSHSLSLASVFQWLLWLLWL